jgi:addiction module HigA family antidote
MTNESINEYNPEVVSLPGDTLSELLEERGMSQVELCERIGRPKKTINEILKGKTAITPDTAIRLERVFGISATFWNNRQREYDESVARLKEAERLSSLIPWLKNFPCLRDMMNKGWLPERKRPELILDSLLTYFGVNGPMDWEAVWGKMNLEAVLRDSFKHSSDGFSLAAYLRKAELEALKIECQPFDKVRFMNTIQEARKLSLSVPEGLAQAIIDLCASSGVRVVFVPLIKGVHVSGAVRWLSKDRPLIVFSCRGKTEDIFWFSFFHEVAHILLHGNQKLILELDGSRGKIEEEADAFARSTLIADDDWKAFARTGLDYSREKIESFAKESGIAPAVVLGRLQHEGLHPQRSFLNAMKRTLPFLRPI